MLFDALWLPPATLTHHGKCVKRICGYKFLHTTKDFNNLSFVKQKAPLSSCPPPHPAMSSSLKLFQISDAVGAEERGGGLWSCRTEILAFIFLFMIVHIHLLRAWCYLKSRSQTSFQLENKSVTQSRWLSIILNHPLHWVNVLLKLLSKLS